MPSVTFHAEYMEKSTEWKLYRDILIGGDHFIDEHLKSYPSEELNDFLKRKSMATVEGYAASEVMKIRDSIFQRMDSIRRTGGDNYEKAIAGRLGGVDLRGSTMNFFMGMEVLLELLFLGKVGVFVDSPRLPLLRTRENTINRHPYLYRYQAEDILDWEFAIKDNELIWTYLLLAVRTDDFPNESGIAHDNTVMYREFIQSPDGPLVRTFDAKASEIIQDWTPLEIPRVPFVLAEMERPLLKDVARSQVALLNISSSDINFAWRGNVIQYVEEIDGFSDGWHLKDAENLQEPLAEDDLEGQDKTQGGDNPRIIKQGINMGRGIAKGLKYPTYIAPPTGPMEISMKKQEQIKDGITQMLNNAVASTRSRFASAESKEVDNEGLFSSLSAIGLILEQGERQIGNLWNLYEPDAPVISVHYPQRYSLKSDSDRREDAKSLLELSNGISSARFRKACQKEIAESLFAAKLPDEDLDEMLTEIGSTTWPTADPAQIQKDIDAGVLSTEGGSLARGYPKGEAEKAKEEARERNAAVAMSQGINLGARGIGDDQEGAQLEKEVSQRPEGGVGERRTRGEAE